MAPDQSSTKMRTFKHLSETERGEISAYLAMGLPLREIARKMNRNVSTLSRESKRGSTQQLDINRKTYMKYFPDVGSHVYSENRQYCGSPCCDMKAWKFLRFIEKKILEDKWSPDAIVGTRKKTVKTQNLKVSTSLVRKPLITLLTRGKCR